jgi:NDP-sugar pyrophosphorylase family protein
VASALRLAKAAGIARVVVNAWHLSDRMTTAVTERSPRGLDAVLSVENELMGTAGGLALARDRGLLGDTGSVLVINGDGDLDLAIESLIDHHTRSDDLVTLALLPHPDPGRWSRIHLDGTGHVTEIAAPGPTSEFQETYLYPGVMVLCRQSIDDLPSQPGDVPDRLWWPALKAGRLGGVEISGNWREVGTPADYLSAVMRRLAGRSAIHPSSSIDPSATITNSFIGRDVTIEGGTEISASVIAEGAVVSRGARIRHSVALGTLRISAHASIDDQYLAQPSTSQPANL